MEGLIVEFAKDLVQTHPVLSFIFFFISQSLQILFPPYPGDMVLILEGYLAGLANFNIVLVTLNAITATFLSSALLYNIGKLEREKILNSKIVKYLFNINQVNKMKKLFDKFGPVAVIISKFIPGIFSLTVLSAGIFQVRKDFVYIAVLFITSIHHCLLIVLGKLLEDNWKLIFYKLNTYNIYIITFSILALTIYGLMYYIKKKLIH